VKTSQLPKFTDLLLSIKRLVSFLLLKRKKKEKTATEDQYGDNLGNIQPETLLQKLKRYYISFSSFPDCERSWILPAAIHAMREIKKEGFNCIMTSSPPHSSHLIGLIAKKITKVKWVADFRDPWIDILPYRTSLLRSELSDRVEKWLEKQVIHNANTIITTTDEHRKAIIFRFPEEPADKFLYIPNGIDSEKFNNKVLPKKYDQFTLSYAGTIYLKRTPEPIFKAIQQLITSGKIQSSEIRFKLFGYCELIDGKPIMPIIKSYGLESLVEVSGPIPFKAAIDILQRFSQLLNRGQLPV
jgi:glycosyltransferase involved in cell wall biosynthesis